MGEGLFTLRHDQGYFETGHARGKQVLLGNTVHEIVAHWFDMAGRFGAVTQLDDVPGHLLWFDSHCTPCR